MRRFWAIVGLLFVGATAGCGVIEGLGSFSEGPCTGGCDASADATEEGADGGSDGTTDSSVPTTDGPADGNGGGNDVNMPDVGGGGCNASTCPRGCCNGSVCEMFASETNTSCGSGGAACSACGMGQECDTMTGKCVCDATSCPTGCCNGNACVPQSSQSATQCGTGGVTCAACGSGDSCTAGVCSCGGTTSCTGCCNGTTCEAFTGESNTSCGKGGAACAPCAANQECAQGQCVCDANSCPMGCCNGNTCVLYASESYNSCGAAGAACAPCTMGQECNLTTGACVCDANSCANGCCNGNVCVPYGSQSGSQCGKGGAACGSCANNLCDLSTGVCACDANTCPSGCCNGGVSGTCEAYGSESNGSCGASGATCASCTSTQECNKNNGQCVCDATSCPNGCCNGDTCVLYANQSPTTQCGTGGAQCAPCGTGDTCTSGVCSCGGGGTCAGCCNGNTCEQLTSESDQSCGSNGATCAMCPMGQECNKATGQCVCDATSCPNGCCNGNVCEAYSAQSPTSCGTKGANCAPCAQPSPDCSNGVCSCLETVCSGTCTQLNTTSNCSACGDKCNLTNAGAATCNGSTCSYTCSAGDSDCNYATAPDTDGCECKTPACCGASCQITHSDGVGQNYYDCNGLYTGAACSDAAAIEACTAYAISIGGSAAGCSDQWGCCVGKNCTPGPPYTVCYSVNGTSPSGNYCWGYNDVSQGGAGALECKVTSTGCPAVVDGTWN